MKILMLEDEVRDFVITAQNMTGGGFTFIYKEGGLILENLDGDWTNWKDLDEYKALKRAQKIELKYAKELAKLIWGEVKKDKDNDLDSDDLIEVQKKIDKHD
jgi:hypothetical protein